MSRNKEEKMADINKEIFMKVTFKQYQEIHQIMCARVRALEEEAFGWLDNLLEEAAEAFGKPEQALLPKTPSAKRKQKRRKSKRSSINQRRLQLDDEHDDYVDPAHETSSRTVKQSRKRQDVSDDELEGTPVPTKSLRTDVDQEFQKQEAPVGRRTRAASRAATTSKARNTRKNTSRKKNKSDPPEPILNLIEVHEAESVICDSSSEQRVQPSPETASAVGTCITRHNRLRSRSASTGRRSAQAVSSPVADVKSPQLHTPTRHRSPQIHTPKHHRPGKTPIQNFDLMNVKEKVHAYEEIVLISPVSNTNVVQVTQNTNNNSREIGTPRQSPVTPKTPATVTRKSVSPKTPEQIVDADVPIETRLSQKKDSQNHVQTILSPVTDVGRSPRQNSSSRKSRQSLRISLKKLSLKHGKVLPSVERRLETHDASKPSRPRTRLRLKKTKQPDSTTSEAVDTTTSSTNHDEFTSTVDGDAVVDGNVECGRDVTARTQDDDDENNADVSDMEMDEPDLVKPKTTRTKTRAVLNNVEHQGLVQSSTRTKTRHTAKTESQQTDLGTDSAISSDERETKSTRTKTRKDVESLQSEASGNEKDSGLGSTDRVLGASSTEGERPRVTRSKMRKPPVVNRSALDTDDSDAFTSPSANGTRVTRTKTRKRQHEEVSDSESIRSKRSCTETSLLAGRDDTPTNTNDEQSSDDNGAIFSCPPNKIVRPKPFMQNMSMSTTKPSNLNPGLVRSFIHRNSPAPKPTLKEIQEKKKKELLEKEKKNEQRLKQREEEHRRKMEEIRRKRAQKMKKVEEIRELNRKKAMEQQLELEKKLAEKKNLTSKLKEDRLKEEKAKQKMRLQKAEEAEERRKQEEDERKRKLKEQLEAEKAHTELLQRKKEQEEHERHRKIAEERQREKDRQAEVERERREEAEKLRQLEEEKKREWQKKKEEREKALALERAEKEKQELERKKEKELQLKKEMEKIREQERLRQAEEERRREQERKQGEEVRKLVEKHNQSVVEKLAQNGQTKTLPKPNLNKTQTLTETTPPKKNDSYPMKPCVLESYDIADLNSGDETDDDEAPRKKIPDWAQGQQFKALLIKQVYNPPDLNKLFPPVDPPDLNEMFVRKRARFNNRTSSAHWTSPIQKHWDPVRKF